MKREGEHSEAHEPLPHTETFGVRFYGEVERPFEQRDLDTLSVPIEGILHTTRHLSRVDNAAREKLKAETRKDGDEEVPIDDAFLDAQLESAGSKFNEKIDDPDALIAFAVRRVQDALDAGVPLKWVRSINGLLWATTFVRVTAEQKTELGLSFDEPLGTSGLVKITPEIQDKVVQEQRGKGEVVDRIVVNVAKGIDIPTTDDLVVVLQRTSDDAEPVLFSTYTGIMAPPMPRAEFQSPEELAYNTEWWSKHTFVM